MSCRGTVLSIVLIVFIVCEGNFSFAAMSERASPPKVLTLEEAVTRVFEIHPDLRLGALRVTRAQEEARLAQRELFPDLDFSYILSGGSGGFGLILTASKLLSPLFSMKSLLAARDAQKILVAKEEAELELTKLDLGLGVKELYVTWLIDHELAQVSRENLERAEKRFHLKWLLHDARRVTNHELLKEEEILAQAREETGKAQILFREIDRSFKKLLKFPPEERLTLAAIDPARGGDTLAELSFDACILLTERHQPLVKRVLLGKQASEKMLRSFPGRFSLESLFLGAGSRAVDSRVGASGSLLLFDWGKRGSEKKLKTLDHEALLLKEDQILREFLTRLADHYSEVLTSKTSIKTIQAMLEEAREGKRKTELLYEAGRASALELFEAETKLRADQASLSRANLEQFLKEERLLRDMGFPSVSEFLEARVA